MAVDLLLGQDIVAFLADSERVRGHGQHVEFDRRVVVVPSHSLSLFPIFSQSTGDIDAHLA